MELVLGLLIGGLCGFLLAVVNVYFTLSAGTLKIDHSDPEKDVYRLEIDNFDRLSERNYVLLHVDHNADLSQK